MKKDFKTAIIWLVITCVWTYVVNRVSPGTPFQAFFASLIGLTPLTIGIIWAILIMFGINIIPAFEIDPEVIKLNLLLRMRQSTYYNFWDVCNSIIEDAYKYPQWDITGSRMFKSWYKYNVDYMLQHPMFFDLTTYDDGSPYIKEQDPNYNIKADPWEETDWNSIELEKVEL